MVDKVMRLVLYYYVCKACGTKFKSPHINQYGQFLMRSDHGELAYLNAIEDSIFNKIGELLEQEPDYMGNEIDRVKILHDNFGLTCDPAKDGSSFQITNKPKCPKCHNVSYSSHGETNPPEIVDIDVKQVTHHNWQKITSERQQLILNLIAKDDIKRAKTLLNL
jgi:hypothetical protein